MERCPVYSSESLDPGPLISALLFQYLKILPKNFICNFFYKYFVIYIDSKLLGSVDPYYQKQYLYLINN